MKTATTALKSAWGPTLKESRDVKMDRFIGVLNLPMYGYKLLYWQNLRKMFVEYWSTSFKMTRQGTPGFSFTAIGPFGTTFSATVDGKLDGSLVSVEVELQREGRVIASDLFRYPETAFPRGIIEALDLYMVRESKR